MQPKEIAARKGPYGCIAIVLTDDEGRLVSHLVRPREAERLARDLLELAGERSAAAVP